MVTSAVFLFVGDDAYSKEKALNKLSLTLLGSSSKDLDYKVFYAQESGADEVLSYLATVPFMASKRLVVVKDFEKSPNEFRARLADYVKNPAKSACLILETKDDSFIEDYGVAQYVSVQRFGDISDGEAALWIKKFLSSRGKMINADALRELKETQGSDLMRLSQELDKLTLFMGERTEIVPADVEAVVGKSIATSAFELTSAIEKADIDEAIRICGDLIVIGKRHSEVIGLLCWYINRILRAKMLLAKGESERRIAGILRIGSRYTGDFFRQVKAFEMPRIKSKIDILLEADADIKRTRFDPDLILEFAVIRLCLS